MDNKVLLNRLDVLEVKLEVILQWIQQKFGVNLILQSGQQNVPLRAKFLNESETQAGLQVDNFDSLTTVIKVEDELDREVIEVDEIVNVKGHLNDEHLVKSERQPSARIRNRKQNIKVRENFEVENELLSSDEIEVEADPLHISDDEFLPPPKSAKSITSSRSRPNRRGPGQGSAESSSSTSSKSKSLSRSKLKSSHPRRRNLTSRPNEVRMLECQDCSAQFRNTKLLKEHQKLVHPSDASDVNPTSFPCPHCSKIFAKKYFLNLHLSRHAGKKRICKVCSKEIAVGGMSSHMLLHQDVKKHKCLECGKQFRQVQSLNAHNRNIHRDVKTQCTVCGVVVKLNSINRHIRNIHENVRKYMCSICGSSFKTTQSLRYHEGTHERGGKRRGLNKNRDYFLKKMSAKKSMPQTSARIESQESQSHHQQQQQNESQILTELGENPQNHQEYVNSEDFDSTQGQSSHNSELIPSPN